MSCRPALSPALALAALLLPAAVPSVALEKTAAPVADLDRDEWLSIGSYSISYWNVCTGWSWVWSGWEPEDRVGAHFELPSDRFTDVRTTWWHFATGAPSGYGFTGTIDLQYADALGCPIGAPLATQAFLPQEGENVVHWGEVTVEQSVVVSVTFGATPGNPVGVASDHPAAGPTGPPACGTCYPTTRATHSFLYGTATSPLCPPPALADGTCDAELILWAGLWEHEPIPVEERSWGKLKSLYR